MLSVIASQAVADLLELDSNHGSRAPTETQDWDKVIETSKAVSVPQPAKTLTDLRVEVLRIVFDHLFSHRELLFTGFLGDDPVLRSRSDAWPLHFLRICKSLFDIANEAFNKAINESKLIYSSCLPPFPYQGKGHMYTKLGKDDQVLSHFVHEKFLERHGASFRQVEIRDLYHRGRPHLQPFPRLKLLTVGTIVHYWACTKTEDVAMEDCFYALYHNELVQWTKPGGYSKPYYFCELITDNERGYNIHLRMMTTCVCHGWWRGIIDVDGKKAVEVEQVEGTAEQALNSA